MKKCEKRMTCVCVNFESEPAHSSPVTSDEVGRRRAMISKNWFTNQEHVLEDVRTKSVQEEEEETDEGESGQGQKSKKN